MIAERGIRTLRSLLRKPVFEKSKANWISELPTVIKKYNISIHNSTKMTTIQAFKKSIKKLVFDNLKDDRETQQPKYKLGQLVRTSDIKRVFSKGDSTNYSYELYTIIEVIYDNLPTYRINYLPERYNQHLLLPTKLLLEENNKIMKELNLLQ